MSGEVVKLSLVLISLSLILPVGATSQSLSGDLTHLGSKRSLAANQSLYTLALGRLSFAEMESFTERASNFMRRAERLYQEAGRNASLQLKLRLLSQPMGEEHLFVTAAMEADSAGRAKERRLWTALSEAEEGTGLAWDSHSLQPLFCPEAPNRSKRSAAIKRFLLDYVLRKGGGLGDALASVERVEMALAEALPPRSHAEVSILGIHTVRRRRRRVKRQTGGAGGRADDFGTRVTLEVEITGASGPIDFEELRRRLETLGEGGPTPTEPTEEPPTATTPSSEKATTTQGQRTPTTTDSGTTTTKEPGKTTSTAPPDTTTTRRDPTPTTTSPDTQKQTLEFEDQSRRWGPALGRPGSPEFTAAEAAYRRRVEQILADMGITGTINVNLRSLVRSSLPFDANAKPGGGRAGSGGGGGGTRPSGGGGGGRPRGGKGGRGKRRRGKGAKGKGKRRRGKRETSGGSGPFFHIHLL